ncbi:MAG TPA: GDP-mannose 4,6-dehydratase, partial [Gammaproteobacteria bacterium]|nr:GDP-mannose 4,6-dehydratase [Gammaproteobacteria bacterium]
FVTLAARMLGIELGWRGNGLDEHAIDKATGKTLVRIDPRYFRPTEVDTLLGDASKARRELGWRAEIDFEQLVREMVDSDVKLAERDALVAREGFSVKRSRE